MSSGYLYSPWSALQGALIFSISLAATGLAQSRRRRKRRLPRCSFGTLLLPGDGADIPPSTLEGNGLKCDLLIKNESGQDCVLVWVCEDGALARGYRTIHSGSIKDGSVSTTHVEYTFAYHSFVVLKLSLDGYPSHLRDMNANTKRLVCSYRPELGLHQHTLRLHKTPDGAVNAAVTVAPLQQKGDLIDTCSKVYDRCRMAGFTVHFEPGVFERHPQLRERFEADVTQAASMLPVKACSLLQSSTAIWLNDSLTYGYKSEPIKGKGCCYHPSREWLVQHSMHPEKSGCIEIYSAVHYFSDIDLWGTGGIILHELSHAYHNKYCLGGYDNEEVEGAYRMAMSRGLYDCVNVHGPQGADGPIKAYGCTNHMEFFAELSVAYLCTDGSWDYNKWFPHNRTQLSQHDAATLAILSKVWLNPYVPES